MTRRFLFSALVLLALGSTACGRYLTTGVAVVNGTSIGMEDLERQFEALKGNPQFAGIDGSNPEQRLEVERQIIVGLIQQELIRQEARRLKIDVTSTSIDQQLAQVRAQFASEDQFNKALADNKLTIASLREQLRDRALLQQVQQRAVRGVTATEDEIRKAYGRGEQFEEIRTRHILFTVTGTDERPARAEAEAVLARLKAGGDFVAIAKAQSDDPGSKAKGGDLGYITRAVQFDQTFLRAAFALREGQLSGLVRTQFGFHIIRVDDRRTKTLAQARAQITQQLTQEKQAKAFEGYIKKRVESARIVVNPRWGDFNSSTLAIEPHQFFVPAEPEPQTGPVLSR